ncbi:receptor-type tyrosine-protein kinase FLT3-like [Stigmatopora argus]
MTFTFAGVVLLCAVVFRGCHGTLVLENTCESSREVECFHPPKHPNASFPVRLQVDAGRTLLISTDGLHDCTLSRGSVAVPTTPSMTPPLLSKNDSGEYALRCGSGFSLSFSLRVVTGPTVPRLTLVRFDDPKSSPFFQCSSQGIPKPTLSWSGYGNEVVGKNEISIQSVKFKNNEVLCCANNSRGRECSQLYDYGLDDDLARDDEVSSVITSPGQALLLRCRTKREDLQWAVWEKDGRVLTSTDFKCPAKAQEMCVRNDTHGANYIAYLFVDSLTAAHNGTYACRNRDNASKSVHVGVSAEGFLEVRLDPRRTLLARDAPGACLEAAVFYHPTLKSCEWEGPDGVTWKCITEDWVVKQRTVKLCHGIQSGEYKLTIKAGGQTQSKFVSVCVVDEPIFQLIGRQNDSIGIRTASAVPANYTWMSCFPGNERCGLIIRNVPPFSGSSRPSDRSCWGRSTWTEVSETWRADSDQLCPKTIESFVRTDLPDGNYFKFCLVNSVGSWCSPPYPVHLAPSPRGSAGVPREDKSIYALKVVSVVLIVALLAVSLALTYHVKRKRPQYQPQLRMIQMVGPNDNDYIYINFKDFEYDRKWEFPRENLELGKELGSGAFGTVVRATAHGMGKAGVSRQVAVKMLKEKHQAVEKEALMSELKMLTHVGHHVNVVNLLGACTESGPVYLIFQYCCHGDLLNYLKSSGERYHKSAADAVAKDRHSGLYNNVTPGKSSPTPQESAVETYIPMQTISTEGPEDQALLQDSDRLEDGESDDDETGDDDLRALTFDDLLSFAVQVAEGMNFLSAKNCIHRDLAARNVLVTKGRLAKIADFGLARDVDNDSNYVVRGNARLPVKWMAPESIFHATYTVKSDVWAYGILLWEIFSMGVTPYPGVKVDQGFYAMIQNGFKMDCPYYADESVYGIMCKCWASEPGNRPSFSKLVAFMSEHLTDSEEKLYQNTISDASSEYRNVSAILDASAFEGSSGQKVKGGGQ